MNSHRFIINKLLSVITFLFIYSNIFAQQATNISIVEKLRSYSGKAFQEKLFLHTDREFYTAGEILWFKVYYVEGAFHKPSGLSKIAYVEIISEKNKPALQTIISLEPGKCKGSFYLPTSLNTGNYIVRAYTNWMKNFDASYFFEKKITIVNTLKADTAPAVKDTVAPAVINLFPEGGNLVNDIQSRVGFTVVDEGGGINDCKGYILTGNGDTITTFTPLKFGIGKFDFKPLADNTYRAVVLFPGGTAISTAMPYAYDYGYIMRMNENEEDQLIVTIKRKKIAGDKNVEQVLLAAHTRQVLKVTERILINNNDSAVLIIDKKRIGPGVTHFTLFNGDDKPVCERLFYVKPVPGITINIKSNQDVYRNRQKVNISLSIQSNIENNPALNLSASVFKMDILQKADDVSISAFMWLTSDIAGNIESPGYYLSDDQDVNTAADNLMLTHGWRRFRWDDLMKNNDSFIKYLPEINGQLITGKVTDIRDDKPAGKIPAYLSRTGFPFGFYISESDMNGAVNFEIKNYYGNQQFVVRPGIETDSFYKIEILKPYAETARGKKYTNYRLKEDIKELLLQKSINMQVQNIYSGDSIRNFNESVSVDTFPFYSFPGTVYKLDDYKRFITMEEVLREYVSGINVGVKNGKLDLKIFNPAAHDFYDGYPLVLLDGVALTDPNRIFSYDPLRVKKLDVITDRYVLGQSMFNGIVSFSTYEGVFDGFELDPKLIVLDYNGLQLQREFYSPSYETKTQSEKRIPDFRNTLLWSPDIITGMEGKASLGFYTSDRAGKYIVILQGISENGDPVSSFTTFQVE